MRFTRSVGLGPQDPRRSIFGNEMYFATVPTEGGQDKEGVVVLPPPGMTIDDLLRKLGELLPIVPPTSPPAEVEQFPAASQAHIDVKTPTRAPWNSAVAAARSFPAGSGNDEDSGEWRLLPDISQPALPANAHVIVVKLDDVRRRTREPGHHDLGGEAGGA